MVRIIGELENDGQHYRQIINKTSPICHIVNRAVYWARTKEISGLDFEPIHLALKFWFKPNLLN